MLLNELKTMIIIHNVLIENEVIQSYFACNLSACLGQCCVEGDGGPPLEEEETQILEQIYPKIAPFLNENGRKAIEEQGVWVWGTDNDAETPLVNKRECAYAVFENGVAKCGIEIAHQAGAIEFPKPISCQLYPIRIKKKTSFEHLSYHKWEICNPACASGEKNKIKLYLFLKNALIRKYGTEFFETLHAIATQS